MYSLEPRQQGSTLTLTVKGEVLLNEVVPFNDAVREFSKKPGISQLVVDLSLVDKMDQAGLGALVSLNTSMQRYGRRLVLMHITQKVAKLLEAAELEGFFATCESEEELRGFIPEAFRKGKEEN